MAALNNALVQNVAMPKNAARHPLVKTGRVSPIMLQPLFKEIDELDYGGKKLSFSPRVSTPRYKRNLGEQGWRSDESARLPPMCPRFPDPASYVG